MDTIEYPQKNHTACKLRNIHSPVLVVLYLARECVKKMSEPARLKKCYSYLGAWIKMTGSDSNPSSLGHYCAAGRVNY